jgi:hypothetical protein
VQLDRCLSSGRYRTLDRVYTLTVTHSNREDGTPCHCTHHAPKKLQYLAKVATRNVVLSDCDGLLQIQHDVPPPTRNENQISRACDALHCTLAAADGVKIMKPFSASETASTVKQATVTHNIFSAGTVKRWELQRARHRGMGTHQEAQCEADTESISANETIADFGGSHPE